MSALPYDSPLTDIWNKKGDRLSITFLLLSQLSLFYNTFQLRLHEFSEDGDKRRETQL